MGTQTFHAVTTRALAGTLPPISPQAYACLLVMAMTAHDTGTAKAPARTYFAGWTHLAGAGLRRSTYGPKDERAVARVIHELTDAGLIKPVGRRHGIRQGLAMYELHI